MSGETKSDSFDERHKALRMDTIALLFGDYAQAISRTYEVMEDESFIHGGLGWEEAFRYAIPRDVLLAELRRMEAWLTAHHDAVWAAHEVTPAEEG